MSNSDTECEAAFTVEDHHAGMRLDVFLAASVEDASRTYLQKLIREGRVRVGEGTVRRRSRTVNPGERVQVCIPPAPTTGLKPENIPLDVLFEDSHVIVVNKPAGLVVHPAPGHAGGTLVNALLYHCADFQRPVGAREDPEASTRPGIVHRLDRDTSGVMVAAKTQAAFDHLARQAREHAFERRYLALVQGEFKEPRGTIEAAIGRSLAGGTRMTVTAVKSRNAITHFEVIERFGVASLVALELETGRTHQIRVHLRFAGHPVLGDPVYGVTDFRRWNVSGSVRRALENLRGQALHAERLGFAHPGSNQRLRFSAPRPDDFEDVVTALSAG